MSAPLRIALFGRPHELWPVAALLAQELPEQIALVVVEHPAGPEPGGALTIPADHRFHHRIGITTEDLIRHCNGTLGLGTDFIGWQGERSHFFSARSGSLPQVNGVALHHVLLRAAMLYEDDPERLAHLFAPFRFAARAAMAGKFAEPDEDPQSPLRLLGATVQFDRDGYTALLREKCADGGLNASKGLPVSYEFHADDRTPASVTLDSGEIVAADLFIDASDELARILSGGMEGDFRSFWEFLPFDTFIAAASVGEHGHMVARALPGGLIVETPLGSSSHSDLFFSSQAMDEEIWRARALGGADPMPMSFMANQASRPWIGNLVRMGEAAGSLGACWSADFLILCEQALKFAECLPAGAAMDIEAAEYNRDAPKAAEEIRDFALLPFFLNGRADAPWAAMREGRVPESLQLRLDQFRSRGRFVPYEHRLFDEQSWIDMLIGFGVVPERYDPMAQTIDMGRLAPIMKTMVATFNATIEAMPRHADYVAGFLEAARAAE